MLCREKKVPNISLVCETRWSVTFKSIHLFSTNFIAIKETLCILSSDVDINQDTCSHASQLDNATSSVICIILQCVCILYHSLYLEPIVQKFSVSRHGFVFTLYM